MSVNDNSNVVKLTQDPRLGTLYEALHKAIDEYGRTGDVPCASIVGILEDVKMDILMEWRKLKGGDCQCS